MSKQPTAASLPTLHYTRSEFDALGSVYLRGYRLDYNEAESRAEGGTGEVYAITHQGERVSQWSSKARALREFVRLVREV